MLYDLHNDLVTAPCSFALKREEAEHFPVGHLLLAVWSTELDDPMRALYAAERLCRGLPYPAGIAIEDAGFLAGDPEALDVGIRYCSLTWNAFNGLAGGALTDGRLTAAGRAVLDMLISRGIAVDTAHLNEPSFFDVLDYVGGRTKILCSHTGLKRFHDHPRNLSDEQVRALLGAGGIAGMAAVGSFLGKPTIDGYADCIASFADAFGTDGLAIGTDFYGAPPLEGLDGYARFGEVADRLNARGFTASDVEGIFFDNAQRFFTGEEHERRVRKSADHALREP